MFGYKLARWASSLELVSAGTANSMLLCPPHRKTSPKRTSSSEATSPLVDWLAFPNKDSFEEFWCVAAEAPIIGPVVMIFCLDPLVKKEKLDAFVQTLKTKHAITITDKLKYVAWPTDYKPCRVKRYCIFA